MNWYCKFCRLFTKVDPDLVCNTCQDKKEMFKYVGADSNKPTDEELLNKDYSEEN